MDIKVKAAEQNRRKGSNNSDESYDFDITDKYFAKLEHYRNHMAQVRLNETPEQNKARLECARIRAAKVRKEETHEQREARLERARTYKTEVRSVETPEQRCRRLEMARRRMTKMRMNESPEHRALRLERTRLYNQEVRRNETPEQRSARLEAARRYMSKVRQNRIAKSERPDKYYKLKTLNQVSDSMKFNKNFDDKYIGDKSNDSLNGEESLQDGVIASFQNQETDKNNIKDIVKILMSGQNFSNIGDKNSTQIKADICSMSEMIKSEPNYEQTTDDFQLNSITGNILPLDEEIQMMIEGKNYRKHQNQYACPKCTKIYRYAHSLKKHLNVHDTVE